MSEENKTEQDIESDDKFKRGYNWGYVLAKFDPETAKDFAAIDSKSPSFEGLRAGKQEFEKEQKEKENSNLPKWMQKDRLTDVFNEKAKDVDKDKEPDK